MLQYNSLSNDISDIEQGSIYRYEMILNLIVNFDIVELISSDVNSIQFPLVNMRLLILIKVFFNSVAHIKYNYYICPNELLMWGAHGYKTGGSNE